MNKQIHFYWGNSVTSYFRYMTVFSFCKLNPDWKVTLVVNRYNDNRVLRNTVEKQDKTEYHGIDYTKDLLSLPIDIVEFDWKMFDLPEAVVRSMSDVHISDIFGWKILSTVGGIVADMDILFVSPIEDQIDASADVGLICFDNYPKKDYIPVSFMYSSGNSPFFTDTYSSSLVNYSPDVYESCGTPCMGSSNLNEIQTKYSGLNVQKLKDTIVFPFIKFPWNQSVNMLYLKGCTLVGEETIGIHWYGGAPQSQRFNNLLNHKTVYEIDNTITHNIRRLL